MSDKDEFRDRFGAEGGSIIEDHMDQVEGWFRYDEQMIVLKREIRELSTKHQLYVYLLAKKMMTEAEVLDSSVTAYDELYEVMRVDDSTVRHSITDLREEGLITTTDGGHDVVPPLVPDGIGDVAAALDGGRS
jgi:DNA-binding transcriptional ArsR family regulator